MLNADGIATYSQLAAAKVDRVRQVLDGAGPHYAVHDPQTWPRQAELAANGRTRELAEYQDRLKGGRET